MCISIKANRNIKLEYEKNKIIKKLNMNMKKSKL